MTADNLTWLAAELRVALEHVYLSADYVEVARAFVVGLGGEEADE